MIAEMGFDFRWKCYSQMLHFVRNTYMNFGILAVLAMAAALSSCATEKTWDRIRPPTHVALAENGCPMITIDDAAPLSQWQSVGSFWDQDVCQGTPFQVAQIKQRQEQSREWVREKAQAGDRNSIEKAKCWDEKSYMSWTAPASGSLIQHQWNAIPYACVQNDDPRLKLGSGVNGTPQVAGN